MKVLEAQHRVRDSLNVSMVLLYDVIQVLARSDFNSFIELFVKRINARSISTALVYIDEAWFSISSGRPPADGFIKKRKAAFVSRFFVSRKSIVFPCLSTAR